MNRRTLFLAGAVLFLVLAAFWFAFVHTEDRKNEKLPARPAFESSNAHNLSQPREPMWQSSITTPQATNEPPANAANTYRRAFALLDALTQDEKKALGDWKAEMDPSLAVELCNTLKPIVDLTHEAATITNCDWEADNMMVRTNFEQMNTHAVEVMQTVGSARTLARAMVWNAAHCRETDGIGAGTDIAATLRIGQSLSQGHLGFLTGTAIERLTMDYLVANAGSLPGDVLARLTHLFDDGQYEESLYRALESHAEMTMGSADKIAAMSPEEAQQALQHRWGEGEGPPTFQTQFVAAARQFAGLEREYVSVLNLPEPQYQAWIDKVHMAEQANPIIATESYLDSIVDEARATVVQRAMITAGLALIQNDPSALQNHPDPSSGETFVYRQTEDGFELESTYQQKGKPVTMSFRYP